MNRQKLATALLAALCASPLLAGNPKGTRLEEHLTEKDRYTLLNPTPKAQIRALSPDRPDVTESPITLDAGHFGLEVSLFDWRRDGGDEVHTFLSTNFKVGLTNEIDLQLVFDTYTREDPDVDGGDEGFGDVQVRLKYNLWGNDGGGSALALFPYVKIPTGASLSNDKWEGGLIVPYSTQVTERIGLGLMVEVDIVYDEEDGRDYALEFIHSAALGIDLTERFGTFLEYVGVSGDDRYQAYGAGGFTFAINDDFVLDCGAQVGLNDDAEGLGVFSGFTTRF